MVFHTYENKHTRPIRVMAKGLDNSTYPLEIVEDLKEKGYKITKTKLSTKTKTPLNMFILFIDKVENKGSLFHVFLY